MLEPVEVVVVGIFPLMDTGAALLLELLGRACASISVINGCLRASMGWMRSCGS